MLQISTVVGCNIGCSYCPQSSHVNAYEDVVKQSGPYVMSFEVFKTCIDKLPLRAPVTFGGFSEPFANPHIIEMLDYCRTQKRRATIQTTLRGLKFEDVDKLMSTKPHLIIIHMPDEEGFMNPPLGRDYFQIIDKFRDYYKNKRRISLVCIGTPIAELVEGFGKIDFVPVSSMDNKRGTFNGHDFIEEIYKDVPNPIRVRNDFDYSVRCRRDKQLNENVLIPNGDVYACIQDYKLELKICNLLTDNWEAHEKGRLRIIKKQESNDKNIKCNTCDLARISRTREHKRRERNKLKEEQKIEEGKLYLQELKKIKQENLELQKKLGQKDISSKSILKSDILKMGYSIYREDEE